MKLILVLTQLYITANGSIEILTNLCRSVRLLNTKQISKKIEMVLLFFKEIIMIISSQIIEMSNLKTFALTVKEIE
jgi:hypothetical protein